MTAEAEPSDPALDYDFGHALASARSSESADAGQSAEAWLRLARELPSDPAICQEIAGRLRDLGREIEADAVLRDAVQLSPEAIDLAVAYARSAGARGDYEEEAVRWAQARSRFPHEIHGYMGGSRALRRLRRQTEAETILLEGLDRFGYDRRLLIDLAVSVTSRADWPAAKRWWSEVERRGWLDGAGYAGLGTSLLRLGELAEAQTKLFGGLAKYPESPDLAVGMADLHTAREDWGSAVEIWEKLNSRFPADDRYANGLGVARWRLGVYKTEAGGEAPAAHYPRPVDVGMVDDISVRELLESFESLGQDCEFGLVQRRFGAEPLGLLRWTTTKPDTLIAGLRTRFANLGEVENTVLDLGKPEIMVNDLALKIRFHTFIQQGTSIDLEKFRGKQARHLRYLRDAFLERLELADRVYVYKYVGDFDQRKADTIFEELRRLGNVSIVFVTRARDGEPAGSVRCLHEGFYVGHLSRYGLDAGPAWNIAFDEWTSICREVLRAAKARRETT